MRTLGRKLVTVAYNDSMCPGQGNSPEFRHGFLSVYSCILFLVIYAKIFFKNPIFSIDYMVSLCGRKVGNETSKEYCS